MAVYTMRLPKPLGAKIVKRAESLHGKRGFSRHMRKLAETDLQAASVVPSK